MHLRKNQLITSSSLIILNLTSVLCSCGRDEYRRCLMLADPLLKDPHLIYPDNLRDIDFVCRTWTQFVDCVKRYTLYCFTEHKRNEFEKAVQSSISLVKDMCSSPDYQTEYLIHAPCMRATLTDDLRCGKYYRQLVTQVTGEPATPELCCTYYRFRECVLDQTGSTCEQHAMGFAQEIMDRAMGFLRDQCFSYKPEETECSGVVMVDWTQPPHNNPDGASTWQREDRRLTQQPPNAPRTWNPNGMPADDRSNTGDTNGMTPTDGGRTSHRRGMNFDPTEGGVQITWKPRTDSSSSITTGATTNIVVDEPNQQGLANDSNSNAAQVSPRNRYVLYELLAALSLVLAYFARQQ